MSDQGPREDLLAAVGEVLGEQLSVFRGEVRGEIIRWQDEVMGVLGQMSAAIETLNQSDRNIADEVLRLKGRLAGVARALDGAGEPRGKGEPSSADRPL